MTKTSRCAAALSLVIGAASLQAATITGTVTNRTANKPSRGDAVVLIDVSAGMAEAATATTNAEGQYSLDAPSMGPYLIRVNHQGGTYFIAAPQGGASGDITVYDVAAKVDGVSIDADMFLVEAAGGMLRVHERYLVRNTSLPPRAQFSANTFEVALPAGAEIDSASATRPGGLPTVTRLVSLSQQGHYTFNIPIQPDQGEKETLFEVQYHLTYNGKYTFAPQLQMPADNLVVYLPHGIDFSAPQGASFQPVQEDPKVQTFVAKNIHPGQSVGFTVAGEGQMPVQSQGAASMAGMGMGSGDNSGARPGGGIGEPIGTPDPLTRYKWWILSFLTLLLITASAFLLRKREGLAVPQLPDAAFAVSEKAAPVFERSAASPRDAASTTASSTSTDAALLSLLKEEIFAIESEKLCGSLTDDEYTRIKTGLDAVLKRVLQRTKA
ncbi:MAG TPA: hypothetical protein VFB43_10420 [Terracidiphilus sp.]|nr:hypothetical protein [Terracidiphilus sp.]